MARFWVNTGHTIYHAGQHMIHAGEEIAEEVIAAIKKDGNRLKELIEAGIIIEEKPQLNTATDQGAPSHKTEQLRPVPTEKGQAGPTAPPVVDAPAPPLAGGQQSQTDASGKPITAGLTQGK